MRDIVTTIQAEQDAIIRLPLSGVVVIEGGPGTGKTAVALHRVAYLLYTHRERLARSGVLVVGPSAGFIHYVGGVLPALGESAVVFTTPGRLAHGVVATAVDPDDGGPQRRAGWRCWTCCAAPSPTGRSCPDRRSRSSSTTSPSRSTGRRRPRPAAAPGPPACRTTRPARRSATRSAACSSEQGVERLDQDLEDPPEFADILRELGDLPEIAPASAAQLSAELRHELRDDLRSDLGFHAAVERLWPVLTPEQAPRRALRVAGPAGLGRRRASTCPGCTAPSGSAWTVADAPLLDELAELLGPPPGPTGAGERDSAGQRAYAAEVLSILESADRQIAGEDPDELRPTDFVTADVLAARQVPEHLMSVAERAAADRDWRFGHLVVDEAQELSAMDWHVLLRRCPVPFDHRGGRPRAAQRPRGSAGVGGRARPAPRFPVDLPDAHGELPDARRDHGAGRRRAGRVRARPAAARVGAGDGRAAVAAHRARGRPRRRGARGRRGGGGAAGPRNAGGDRRRPARPGRPAAQLHTPVSAKGLDSTPS